MQNVIGWPRRDWITLLLFRVELSITPYCGCHSFDELRIPIAALSPLRARTPHLARSVLYIERSTLYSRGQVFITIHHHANHSTPSHITYFRYMFPFYCPPLSHTYWKKLNFGHNFNNLHKLKSERILLIRVGMRLWIFNL